MCLPLTEGNEVSMKKPLVVYFYVSSNLKPSVVIKNTFKIANT